MDDPEADSVHLCRPEMVRSSSAEEAEVAVDEHLWAHISIRMVKLSAKSPERILLRHLGKWIDLV